MNAILSILPLIQSAFDVIGSFRGTAAAASTASHVQEAIGVVNALTPLVTRFTSGEEVTADDVRVALAGKDSALAEFDKAIAAAGG